MTDEIANVSLVTLDELNQTIESIDWNRCYICQIHDEKVLQNPSSKRGNYKIESLLQEATCLQIIFELFLNCRSYILIG